MSKKIVPLGFLALGAIIMLTGCVIPVYESTTSNVDQGKDESYIQFVNVQREHQIFIDGTSIGSGKKYNPAFAYDETYDDSGRAPLRGVLAVSPGTHLVEITKDGRVLYQRKIFLSAGSTKSVTIPQ